jgi:glyoxylase-like metal-dependent hydrolase (beta-lactamase superfamily II)
VSDHYEVYAIKYATMPERMRSGNFIAIDPHDDAPMPIDYYVWAVIGEERSYVIDTGFDAATAAQRGRTLLRTAAEGLAMVGVDAAAVEDIVATHMHYDHIGSFDQFPRARYHLQELEMRFATGPHMCTAAMNYPFEADHVATMVHRVFEGRVRFYDGAAELAPGITLHHVGGHTMGLQVVRVRTRRGWVVLASDASHFYENMERTAPFPIVYNLGDMVRAYDTLRDLADSPAHIVPGHDPLVLDRYPAPSDDLKGIVARLDADPA